MTRFGTTSKLVAATLGGALVLTACSGGGTSTGTASSAIVFAYEQEIASWNPTTADGNTAANLIPTQWVTTGFWYWGEGGTVTPNKDFGSYEVVSENPLTVKYTIDKNAVWSDGEPIDCDDVLLNWSQQGGYLGWSAPGTNGMEDVKLPDCEPGDKQFTYEYRRPFANWETSAPGHGNNTMMPAHIVAKQGGLESGDELVDIIKSVNWEDPKARKAQAAKANKQLAEAIDFFQNGWLLDGGLPDPELIPSSGPYVLSAYEPGEQVTLTRNAAYWGKTPATDEIVIRYIEQDEQAQALQNGEVDIMSPQPSPDLKKQLEGLQDVQLQVFDQYIYENITFNFDSGPFAQSRALRRAFMMCVPRERIVENLIRPITPEAEVRDTLVAHPLDPYYEQVVDASLPEEFAGRNAGQNIPSARRILRKAGAEGTTIRLGTLDNPRRTKQAQLIQDDCNQAGFDVRVEATADFFEDDGALYENRYDVAMFAWHGSPAISEWTSTYETVDACTAQHKGNNIGCYSSKRMNDLIDQALRTSDPDERATLVGKISAVLWDDAFGLPLFNHPGMAAWTSNVQNVVPNPADSDIVWNMPEWRRT